ncbi:hypothetical protein UFOVP116_215 [uncultured Caudovirales phage]|uniref:Uncharacterized protein n=1 Tax=uncultured Caudovirales phage TaxID=2100421 RepID=A0A6J5L6I3_9CAUD|nr:hypothetical protein UFOVP116_215 [uncultured Caudovirales phage]
MTDREVMQQALEALELHAKQYPHMQKGYTVDAITALSQALDHIANVSNMVEQPKQEPVLQDIEQYRIQMAGICTAAIGYWKETDGIHPDYDTVALRDVAKLYAKYDALYKAQLKQEPVSCVVLREGLPTLLQDRNIKSTEQRLYTSPPAQRKPLTRDQALKIVAANPDAITAIRMTEAAHGIGEMKS